MPVSSTPKYPTLVLILTGNCNKSWANHALYFLNTTQFGQHLPQYTCMSSPAPFLQCAGDATCLHFLHLAGPVLDSLDTVPCFSGPTLWYGPSLVICPCGVLGACNMKKGNLSAALVLSLVIVLRRLLMWNPSTPQVPASALPSSPQCSQG